MPDDRRYWVAFSLVRGVGPQRIQRMLDYFGDLTDAWRAPPGELLKAGLEAKLVDSILTNRTQLNLDNVMRRIDRLGLRVLTLAEELYPELLKHVYGPPAVLYCLGELTPADEQAVAIVGTRRATVYGKEAAQRIATGLAQRGITVVSGLAKGIDSAAHRAALDTGGRTVAVLGSGLDVIYPPENASLAKRIVAQGALISEYPPGTPPDANNFPVRNRIISGLSRGILVVEAGERSGALITADFALDQGRDVYAVPGNIFSPASTGTNRLIQQGAKLVSEADDIVHELNLERLPEQLQMRELLPENDTEAALLKLLSPQPQHIDELVRQSGLPAQVVSSALSIMELKGMVRHVGRMNYVTAR